MLNKIFQSNHHGFTLLNLRKANLTGLNTRKSNLTGFTLIEVLVAIFVLVVGVFGVFFVVQNITFSSQLNSSKLTAAYLVQEGIELVRNKRDSNWLANLSWDSDLPSGTETGLLGKFTRTTLLFPKENKIVVTVEVSWQERGKDYSVTAQTELENWGK